MSKPTLTTRLAVLLFSTMAISTALALTFAPMAFGQEGCGSLHPDACAAAFGTPTNNPNPVVTPPPRNYPAEHAAAYSQAFNNLKAQYRTPDWRVWPDPSANQIVHLWSFFAITDSGWDPIVGIGTNGPAGQPPTRVVITATPMRSVWTLTELGTGASYDVVCDGQGTPWEAGLTGQDSDCGWEFEHTSDVIGQVELTVQIEYEIRWTSTAPGFGPGEGVYISEPSSPATLTVSEVQTFGATDYASGRGASATVLGNAPGAAAPGDGSPADGVNEDNEGDVLAAASLPVRTLTCVARIQAGGDFILGADGTTGYRYILQEYADGRRVLTVAEDNGAAGGVGASAGARAYIGDVSVGLLAKAEAKAWAVLSNGEVHELGADESVNSLLLQLGGDELLNEGANGLVNLLTPPGTSEADRFLGLVSGGHISLLPELPEFSVVARDPDSEFTEISTFGSADATAQAGIGILVGTASIGADAGVTERVHTFSGGFSRTTTYAGSFAVDITVAEHDVDQTSGFAAEVEGSISVETIYNNDGEAVEVIYTRTYSSDADFGNDLGGPEDDARSVTTQQWSFDLSDPAAAQAIADIDASYPTIPTAVPVATAPIGYLFGNDLDQHAITTGPIVQQIQSSVVPFGIEAGLGIDAEVSGEIGCVEIS